MGSETFYCIQCGIRVSGVDLRGDRSHCPSCLGLPVEPTPRPGRESSKRIRKPPSGTATAVATRPRTADIVRPKTSRTLIVGALSFAGAVLFALTTLTFSPVEESRPSEKTSGLISQPPIPQVLEKTSGLISQPAAPQAIEKTSGLFSQDAPVDLEVESLADQRYDEIEEAASALADEGRFDDALARIRAFPAEYRRTRAWNNLEGLRRQIEARARTK